MVRLRAFAGVATVAGEEAAVSYDTDGKLTIGPLPPMVAWRLLELLAATPVAFFGDNAPPARSVVPTDAPPPEPPTSQLALPLVPAGAALPSPQPRVDQGTIAALARAVPAKEPKEPKEAPKERSKRAARALDPAASVDTFQRTEPTRDDGLAPVAEATPPEAAAEVPPAALPTDAVVPEAVPTAVLEAKKLRDVMTYFVQAQSMGLDQVITELHRIQSQVPLLARLEDLDGRARRTWEVMDLEGM